MSFRVTFADLGPVPNSIAVSNLVAGLTGQVVGGTTPAYLYPPGYELNYTQITANANVTDTSEATATALISPGAITFDGTAVKVEFFCASVQTDSAAIGDLLTITLFEGATQIGRLAVLDTVAAQIQKEPIKAEYRFTPTAGSHTYKVCAFTTSVTGTPTLVAGAGGTGVAVPAFIRFVKI